MTDALEDRTLRRPTRELIQAGRGELARVLEDIGAGFTLVTQPGPRAELSDSDVARAGVIYDTRSLARDELERLAALTPHGPTVVGVGGGVVMDTAKWLAWRSGSPLVLAPSILSVDACVTNTVAVRDGNRVSYQGFVEAERVVLDVDLVQRAPTRFNRAGAGDLLSIHTALWDWASGESRGGAPFDAQVGQRASAVLDALDRAADGLAVVSEEALVTVLRGYADINDMTVRCGHAQMEEGSEHYLGYFLEQLSGTSFVHGEIVTLGVVIMSRLQHNDPERARQIADRCGVQWYPAQLGLSRAQLIQAVVGLADYVRKAGLPPSIAADHPVDEPTARELLDGLV